MVTCYTILEKDETKKKTQWKFRAEDVKYDTRNVIHKILKDIFNKTKNDLLES